MPIVEPDGPQVVDKRRVIAPAVARVVSAEDSVFTFDQLRSVTFADDLHLAGQDRNSNTPGSSLDGELGSQDLHDSWPSHHLEESTWSMCDGEPSSPADELHHGPGFGSFVHSQNGELVEGSCH
jgi:hypothetical protein